MNALRNFPVFLWWVAILFAIVVFPNYVFAVALIFFLAAPFRSMLLPRDEGEILVPTSLSLYTNLMSMSVLGLVKAAIYDNRVSAPSTGILDTSRRKKKQ